MAVAALLLLICAVAAPSRARVLSSYDLLPDDYRQGVDLALQHLDSHAGVQHHFRFLRSQAKSDMESGFGVTYYYHHFYLKPTTCAKGTADSSAQTCPFRNNRPLMDCVVCYKKVGGEIEAAPPPYIHCIQRPRLTEEMQQSRNGHCKKMIYNNGGVTLLAVSTN